MIRLTILFTFIIWGASLNAQIGYRVGFHSMIIQGDIDPIREIVNGIELSGDYPINELLYCDAAVGFSHLSGLDAMLWAGPARGGSLTSEEFLGIGTNRLHPNYATNYTYTDLGVSLKPSVAEGLLRLEIGAGLGFSISQIKMDLKSGNDAFYNFTSNFSRREDILSRMDGIYETKYSSGKTFLPHLYVQVGIAIDIADNVHLSLNIKSQFANSDHLDTVTFNDQLQQLTRNKDSVRSMSLGFHYQLGDETF